jgi:hypothetical protein
VIGVHTPEFEFEKNIDNVSRAVRQMRIEYPVVIDNEYAIWRASDNQYWPAPYAFDAHDHVRHHHFGEGDYGASERAIQQLLVEAGVAVGDQTLLSGGKWPRSAGRLERVRRFERSDGPDRLSVPCAGSPSRHGPATPRTLRPFPRVNGRPTTKPRARPGRGRQRPRRSDRSCTEPIVDHARHARALLAAVRETPMLRANPKEAVEPTLARTMANATFMARRPAQKAKHHLQQFAELVNEFGKTAAPIRTLAREACRARSASRRPQVHQRSPGGDRSSHKPRKGCHRCPHNRQHRMHGQRSDRDG